MNPVKQIGRYQLPILNVVGIAERTGWRVKFRLRKSGYDVLLTNGHTIHFTEAEKQQYDEAIEDHAVISQVYGMCRGVGLRT